MIVKTIKRLLYYALALPSVPMGENMILVPAYGRDYDTSLDVQTAWNAGKDFKIADVSSRWDGRYTSIRDYDASSPEWQGSYIRYNKLQDITHIGIWE